jgi:hypothetical protein
VKRDCYANVQVFHIVSCPGVSTASRFLVTQRHNGKHTLGISFTDTSTGGYKQEGSSVHLSNRGELKLGTTPLSPSLTYALPQTTLPTFQHKTSSGERTYSEFERLASHLTLLYEDLFVPALPDLSVSTVSGQRPEDEENVLIARIRRWVNRITTHPLFKASELVREFAESGQGVSMNEWWEKGNYCETIKLRLTDHAGGSY